MLLNLKEDTVRTIWVVLGNCINYLRYNEDGDCTTLTEGFQNLVHANEEFTLAIIKSQKDAEVKNES